jgi:hypothetical protein
MPENNFIHHTNCSNQGIDNSSCKECAAWTVADTWMYIARGLTFKDWHLVHCKGKKKDCPWCDAMDQYSDMTNDDLADMTNDDLV